MPLTPPKLAPTARSSPKVSTAQRDDVARILVFEAFVERLDVWGGEGLAGGHAGLPVW
ncbi:MAG: hypothetical protein U5Q44_03180 [Dehalococcoidia bacterium]|nr:hypothetical protein [Dehalococcoidia bacterium]